MIKEMIVAASGNVVVHHLSLQWGDMNLIHGNDGEATWYGNNNLNSYKSNGNHSSILSFHYEKINTNVHGESGVFHKFELFAQINHLWNTNNVY